MFLYPLLFLFYLGHTDCALGMVHRRPMPVALVFQRQTDSAGCRAEAVRARPSSSRYQYDHSNA
jgi:hypothetical protein